MLASFWETCFTGTVASRCLPLPAVAFASVGQSGAMPGSVALLPPVASRCLPLPPFAPSGAVPGSLALLPPVASVASRCLCCLPLPPVDSRCFCFPLLLVSVLWLPVASHWYPAPWSVGSCGLELLLPNFVRRCAPFVSPPASTQ